MVEKYPGPYGDKKYNVRVTDIHGNSFIMLFGGNLDLYWYPEKRGEGNRVFEIDESDELLYGMLVKLFDDIKKNDDKYEPALIDNTFTFISEDLPEDEANRLTITKDANKFLITFVKSEVVPSCGLPSSRCQIRFCNSGSRVPKIEILFMMMFNELAYYNDEVQLSK